MDKRNLKDGRIRLRFKLSEEAFSIVDKAINATRSSYPHVALDYISLDFIAEGKLVVPPKFNTSGSNRFLVKFYPDQYQTFMDALEIARKTVSSHEDALVAISLNFINSDKAFLY